MIYRLSPSSLNVYRDCPKCFWLEKVNGISRPRGIFPSLPGGMDKRIKGYFDGYRAQKNIPPEIRAFDKELKLFDDQDKLNLWREWRTGLQYVDKYNNILFGALDDLIVQGDSFVPFDYKTKGSTISVTDALKYYQLQLDGYSLMLESNGMRTSGYGILMYYSPIKVTENGLIQFETQLIKINTDPERAKNTFKSAIALLASEIPKPSSSCMYCQYIHKSRLSL